MKIFLASDLHIKSSSFKISELPKNADLIVLAGDIDNMKKALEYCETIALELGVPVIFVPGNHEFHGGNIGSEVIRAKEFKAKNVHVLINESVIIDGVRFIGSPLWTNFLSDGVIWQNHAMAEAGGLISDFYKTSFTVEGESGRLERPLSPKDILDLNVEAQGFISKELTSIYNGPTIVITHFSPSKSLEKEVYSNSNLSAYFHSECSTLIEKHKPDFWFYGHTHHSVDTVIGATRFCSNQYGFVHEGVCDTGFRSDWIIDLETLTH